MGISPSEEESSYSRWTKTDTDFVGYLLLVGAIAIPYLLSEILNMQRNSSLFLVIGVGAIFLIAGMACLSLKKEDYWR